MDIIFSRSLSSEAVQKLLSESLRALVDAPNRALKRRVRQRLHKKPLGEAGNPWIEKGKTLGFQRCWHFFGPC